MRIHSQSVEEHADVPLPDDGRWESLVAHFSSREKPRSGGSESNRCFVVSVRPRGSSGDADSQLAEIVGLVEAHGDQVAGTLVMDLGEPDPRTLLRKGALERVAEGARRVGAELLVFDAELTPSQARNAEEVTGFPISDREAVILNVFEKNARTKRARLQVEIARLQYLRPRIRGIGLNMDQQMGGIKGDRGPGETASELLARRLDGRLAQLQKALSALKRSDTVKRKHRKGAQRLTLVGYTNAGKTSLMNALTHTELSARDSPFETLETTSRALTRHGGDVLLSDTVGFIRRLPERLMASFESTLAEVLEADLLVIVVDISDPEHPLHLETTERVLHQLGADGIGRFYAFNKLDRWGGDLERSAGLARGNQHAFVSSFDPASVETLRERLLGAIRSTRRVRRVFVPFSNSELVSLVYAETRVLRTEARPRGLRMWIESDDGVFSRIERMLGKDTQ